MNYFRIAWFLLLLVFMLSIFFFHFCNWLGIFESYCFFLFLFIVFIVLLLESWWSFFSIYWLFLNLFYELFFNKLSSLILFFTCPIQKQHITRNVNDIDNCPLYLIACTILLLKRSIAFKRTLNNLQFFSL